MDLWDKLSLPTRWRRGSQSLTQSPPPPDQASNIILGAMSRGRQNSSPPTSPKPNNPVLPSRPVGGSSRTPRAPSPFFRARRSRESARARDTSPEVGALERDAYESDGESVGRPTFRPQSSAWEDDESGTENEDEELEEDELDDDELELIAEDGGVKFDQETTQNTEANALFYEGEAAGLSADPVEEFDKFGEEIEQDLLGEGPNVVVPEAPIFPVDAPVRRKTLLSGLDLVTSRPSYARDRCTITLTHGDPDAELETSGKRLRRYVVLSDLSDESRYAVEWAIGTVARDGDEVFLISVKEDESKVDPKTWTSSDGATKLRVQREVGPWPVAADVRSDNKCACFLQSKSPRCFNEPASTSRSPANSFTRRMLDTCCST